MLSAKFFFIYGSEPSIKYMLINFRIPMLYSDISVFGILRNIYFGIFGYNLKNLFLYAFN